MYLKQTQNKFSSQMTQPLLNLSHSKWKRIAATHFPRLNSWVATLLRIQLTSTRIIHFIWSRHLARFQYHQLRSKPNRKLWTLNFPKKDQARTWVQIVSMLINRSSKTAAKTYSRITPIWWIVWSSKTLRPKMWWWITRLLWLIPWERWILSLIRTTWILFKTSPNKKPF